MKKNTLKNGQQTMFDRLKTYENQSKSQLLPKTPAILRIRNRSFSKISQNFESPYEIFSIAMQSAALAVCNEIQTAKLAYVTPNYLYILLYDCDNLEQKHQFNGAMQKITAFSSSIVTHSFNNSLKNINSALEASYFDAVVYNIPKHEVSHAFIYAQRQNKNNLISKLAITAGIDTTEKLPEHLYSLLKVANVSLSGFETTDKGFIVYRYNDYLVGYDKEGSPIKRNKLILCPETPSFSIEKNYFEQFLQ
jgi:tRNA(His) 5'-end guanylyltransferase